MQRANTDQNIQHVAFTVEVAVEMQTDVPDVRVLVRELLLKFLAKPNVRLTSGGGTVEKIGYYCAILKKLFKFSLSFCQCNFYIFLITL